MVMERVSVVAWCCRGLASSCTALEHVKASETFADRAMRSGFTSVRRALSVYTPLAVAEASNPVAMIMPGNVWNDMAAVGTI